MISRALRLTDPPSPLTAGLVRLLLKSVSALQIECQGFAWWPRPKNGERIELKRIGPKDPPFKVGELVLIEDEEKLVDLLRVLSGGSARADLFVALDTDPSCRRRVAFPSLLARTGSTSLGGWLAARLFPILSRFLGLLALMREMRAVLFEKGEAESVREKYASQAENYAALTSELHPTLKAFFSTLPRNSSILVGGCGTGPDLIHLSALGHKPVGCDFSSDMLQHARRRPELKSASVAVMDLRSPCLISGFFNAIYLTPGLLCLLPGRAVRVNVLRRLAELAGPGGHLVFGARTFSGVTERLKCLLFLQAGAGQVSHSAEWGDWYTSYTSAQGKLCHSYVHIFSGRAIRKELSMGGWGSARYSDGFWIAEATVAAAPMPGGS